jgi:hypothetical protein
MWSSLLFCLPFWLQHPIVGFNIGTLETLMKSRYMSYVWLLTLTHTTLVGTLALQCLSMNSRAAFRNAHDCIMLKFVLT